MDAQALNDYLVRFANLQRNKNKEKIAPHKPIFLLAVLEGIERGSIAKNEIRITPELTDAFRVYCLAFAPSQQNLRIAYPFRHLYGDGFWELYKSGRLLNKSELGEPTSIKQLEEITDFARFSPDLWQLLEDKVALGALRSQLLKTYFNTTTKPEIPDDPLDYATQKLIAEAQSKFRTKKISESKDDVVYYLRHAAFPRIVKAHYFNACAVCGLNVKAKSGTEIIDAAHILPFSQFHNDDPRNGIALCKNHHWSFDFGWFAINDDYTLRVSKQLQNVGHFVKEGAQINFPSNEIMKPAQESLKWHRENKLLK